MCKSLLKNEINTSRKKKKSISWSTKILSEFKKKKNIFTKLFEGKLNSINQILLQCVNNKMNTRRGKESVSEGFKAV